MNESVSKYLDLLREDVFFVRTKWPQFNLLLDELVDLSISLPAESSVLSLERNGLYGGSSLFAPIFKTHNFVAVDCTPPTNQARGAYNAHLVERIRSEFGHDLSPSTSVKPSDLASSNFDLVIVPNLLHHVVDLEDLFSTIERCMAPRGSGYIFDSTLREWHQIPDDFYRLTPYALSDRLEKVGLSVSRCSTTGGPFSAILYCWQQALEYLTVDKSLHAKWSQWIENVHRDELLALEADFKSNPVRPSSSFPTAYSVTFHKGA
jgi:hypothetical protein